MWTLTLAQSRLSGGAVVGDVEGQSTRFAQGDDVAAGNKRLDVSPDGALRDAGFF